MSAQSLTLRKIYVVDTSYLLELFKVDGNYTKSSAEEIKKRFLQAGEAGDLVFVPLPCIYELGNHIADVRDGTRRRELAYEKVLPIVKQCINDNMPWTITPATGIKRLSELWDKFANEYIHYTKRDDNCGSIGLVDAAIIYEAKRLKEEYKKRISKVHIWTKDTILKPHEPDEEPNPFVN
ncbi:hypothetical protein QUF72_03480 [Desulfobacterales bacterium HSG2]|nr:hypothetical protein [Desulfobacterales bacterium HSG2]